VATDSWEYGWQWRAACRGEDAGLFFAPSQFEPKDERLARERQAKVICSTCSVRMECLEYALRIREPYGVWGGLNELERRLLLKDRDRPADRRLRVIGGDG
jgi:WhiB family redox-sensing transcriptional regulator